MGKLNKLPRILHEKENDYSGIFFTYETLQEIPFLLI